METGADILDINVGVPGIDEVAVLPKVAKLVSELVDVPLCLDSANHKAIAAALAVVPGKPLVNSVNGEEESLEAVLPVVKEFGVSVIGLTMDDNGIPADAETRVAIADKILERAAKLRHSSGGCCHRSIGAYRGSRQQSRIGDFENDPDAARKIRGEHKPGRQQRLLRAPGSPHRQPGLPFVGHGHRCDLRHHRPDQTDQYDPGDRFADGSRYFWRPLYRLLAGA